MTKEPQAGNHGILLALCGPVVIALLVIAPFVALQLLVGSADGPPGRPDLMHPPGYDRLIAAVEAEDYRKVEAVLNSGVNPNVHPNVPITMDGPDVLVAINEASLRGDFNTVKILLRHRANLNLDDSGARNALQAATMNGYVGIMRLLLQAGAKVNDATDGRSALWIAAGWRHPDAVLLLLKHGANPNAKIEGKSLLRDLEQSDGSAEIIRILKAKGAKE